MDNFSPELGALTIIKGQTRPMDMFAAVTPKQTIYSFLSVYYGFISDVDIDSDRLRMLGPARFPLVALYKVAKFQKYKVRIHLLPANDTSVKALDVPQLPSDVPPQYGPCLKYTASPDCHSAFPIHIDTSIVYFNVMNLQWASRDFLAEANARMSDGVLWVNYSAPSITRAEILQQILHQEIALDADSPNALRSPVKAFVLEPLEAYGKGAKRMPGLVKGIVDVSGEEVDFGPIRCEILPSLVTVFVPSWLDQDRSQVEAAEARAKIFKNKTNSTANSNGNGNGIDNRNKNNGFWPWCR
ncbi:hypothetical protein SeMB42_g01188 [Synchytrium endobioticum]|nr:hypothetical protein SeMB42_g01188 [Synchytrium endobioticum]